MAARNGPRGVVKMPGGDSYKGEWQNDLKHGKGTYRVAKTGAVYEGDFVGDRREGFGIVSIPGPTGKLRKQYAGSWLAGKKHGHGTAFYDEHCNERYEGEWLEGKRSGWGRMHYKGLSVYEGEWLAGRRCGTGLHVLENGNRYEGQWLDGKKHGPGRFFYVAKGQVYAGTWVHGTAKCGEFCDILRDDGPDATQLELPKLTLVDAESILSAAAAHHMATSPTATTSPAVAS